MKNEYVIGISAFYHDSSACLFKNGKLVFACEEERFTGIKHDSSFPNQTLDYIFTKFKLTKNDISAVCYYESPKLKKQRVVKNLKKNFFKSPTYTLKSYFEILNTKQKIHKLLKRISDNVFYSDHHKSHLYYGVYTSNFEECNVLAIDGVGETDTISFAEFKNNELSYRPFAEYPFSLGLFYSAMTSYLGFKPNEGEYKLMGLASFGDESIFSYLLEKLIKWEDGELWVDMDKFCWDRDRKLMFNEKLIQHLVLEPRMENETISKDHKDLAFAVQQIYETILFEILNFSHQKNPSNNIVLSGGSAYNGTANGKIQERTPYKQIWIPSAPSDAGSSVGSCIHYLVNEGKLNGRVTKNPFLGPEYGYTRTISSVEKVKKYSDEELIKVVAQHLHEQKVVGWFQGRIEFGARALGNRSILASPIYSEMKRKINKVIKKREGFRPFAPMVRKSVQDEYFELNSDVPYMNQVVKVRGKHKSNLGAVTHVDGTARVQTIFEGNKIDKLLLEYEKLSGYPILLNTSFNVKDQTMILTPETALKTFYDTEMDILVLGNYVIEK
jgi:carbamoyltransferase